MVGLFDERKFRSKMPTEDLLRSDSVRIRNTCIDKLSFGTPYTSTFTIMGSGVFQLRSLPIDLKIYTLVYPFCSLLFYKNLLFPTYTIFIKVFIS